MIKDAAAKMNWRRVIRGGCLFALVYALVAAPGLYFFLAKELMAGLARLGRPVNTSIGGMVGVIVFGLVYSVVSGVLAIWLYAAIRPRFGSGPRTAIISGTVFWALTVVAPVSHLALFGVVSARFVVLDLPAEALLILLASLAGAWQYEE